MDSATSTALQTILWSVVAASAVKLRKKRKRKVWCKQWLARRRDRGSFAQIHSQLQTENLSGFENCTGMTVDAFHDLLSKVEPYISKEDTHLRTSISPGARLEATLRFLAAGGSYTNLQYSTRISKQSLSCIIPETCEAIYNVLREEYLKTPTTPEDWKAVAKGFEQWDFPHCVGAMDGKHIIIRSPTNNRSYYNYMGTHSIVLLAVVNANYEFLYVDVPGGGVWDSSALLTHVDGRMIGLPEDEAIPGSQMTLPFVFLGDEAFPLKQHLMTPYSSKHQHKQERIFSHRLARARRTVENAFGILANKFRVLQNAINLEPDKVERIILACTALHNYQRRNYKAVYTPPGSLDCENVTDGTFVPGSWRNDRPLLALERSKLRENTTDEGKNSRKAFTEYFNGAGAVLWQS